MAHSAPSNPSGARSTSRAEEPSVGALVQSAMAAEGTDPSSDLNAQADYRQHLAQVLTRRALAAAAGL